MFKSILYFIGWISIFTVLLAIFYMPAHAGEACYPSREAIRAVHPTGHISWMGHPRVWYFDPDHRYRHTCDVTEIRQAKAPLPKERPTAFAYPRKQKVAGVHTRELAQAAPIEKNMSVADTLTGPDQNHALYLKSPESYPMSIDDFWGRLFMRRCVKNGFTSPCWEAK